MYTIYAGLKNSSKHISWDEFTGSIGHEFAEKQGPHCGVGWWVLDGEIVRQPNAEELQAREDATQKSQEDQLRSRTLNWQKNEGRCDSNYSDLMSMGRMKSVMDQAPMTELLQSCFDWLDGLWAVYDSAKTSRDYDVDYDIEVGAIPVKYDDLRAEIEA
tara:strand:- start:263 stop:739 length:477 start_codon:yes stop_codon:yes gene_type:complete